MKITNYGTIASAGSTKKRGNASRVGGFADLLAAAGADDATAVAQTEDIAVAAPLSNILALQEISEEDSKRRKLVQQGKSLLEVLESLRRQLLTGTLPPHLLQDLSHQLSLQKQLVMDPKLNEIIEDIELRAAVELAKLQTAIARQASPD